MKEIFGQPIQHVSSDSEDTDDLIEKISFVDQPGEIEGGRQKQSKITTCKVTGPVKGVTGSNFGVTFGRLYRCIVFGSLQAFSWSYVDINWKAFKDQAYSVKKV